MSEFTTYLAAFLTIGLLGAIYSEVKKTNELVKQLLEKLNNENKPETRN